MKARSLEDFDYSLPHGCAHLLLRLKLKKRLPRPTNSPVDNFDHNSDLMTELSSLGLTVTGSDNFIPRVMRKRLTVNFHNFSITSPVDRWLVLFSNINPRRHRVPPAAPAPRGWNVPTCASHHGVHRRRCSLFSRAQSSCRLRT